MFDRDYNKVACAMGTSAAVKSAWQADGCFLLVLRVLCLCYTFILVCLVVVFMFVAWHIFYMLTFYTKEKRMKRLLAVKSQSLREKRNENLVQADMQ